MTFFHFGNCVALAFVPYLITYKFSGLSEYSTFYKCVYAGEFSLRLLERCQKIVVQMMHTLKLIASLQMKLPSLDSI